MKRIGNLWASIVEPDNLRLAFWKASKGKRGRADQREFQANLDMELARLREGLIEGCYPIGHYNKFKIFDPKERQICAASFGERVLHHALMNVCEPYFDRRLIFDTYACRTGKGQWRAVARARQFAALHAWYLKCDIAKFFDSIPHAQLKMTLRKVFKDRILLDWFDRIVDTYSVEPGRGLPIGNLTSQHFANLYMDKIDRLCGLHYVRYMDDFVFWADDKDALRAVLASVRMAADSLGLQLKDSPEIRETRGGMDFLGMRVFPGRIRANRRSIRRYERRVAEVEMLHRFGRISEEELQGRVSAMTAFLQQGGTLGWRRKFWGTRREASGSNRVMRGGSWNNDADNCRSSNRNNNTPSNDNNNNGFRLFCSAAPQGSELAVPAGFPSLKDQGEYRCDSALVGRGPKITNRSFI